MIKGRLMQIAKFYNEISIVISGEAGQGIQTMEQLISRTAKRHG